jgi:hypothetical protein
MLSPLKRLAAIAGITCAACGVGPVALAGAATPPSSALGALSPPALSIPSPFSGAQPLFPGLSCSVNQGLFPGIPNLLPTGPLGPLGPHGPLGNTNKNLPCGADVFNLGPSGPLGPHGALGTPNGQ